MTEQTKYRFWVKPKTDNTNEMIAELLTARNGRTTEAEDQTIEVDGIKIHGTFLVEHEVITRLKRSVHAKNIVAYVQENEGQIRLYTNYQKSSRPLSQTRKVKDIKQQLLELKTNNQE